jgi:hypothetical protein
MRPLLPLLLLGCAASTSDFVEAHGSFADGTALDLHLPAQAGVTTSLQPSLGSVSALIASASGPEDLRGLRLEWFPTQVQVGTAYASAPAGPVIFYVERTQPDGGALDLQASVVNGGAVTFTDYRRVAVGTLANLVLMRGGQTILTVASGSFRATNP